MWWTDFSIARRTFLLNWRGLVEFGTDSILGLGPERPKLLFLFLLWLRIVDDLHGLCAALTAKWAPSCLASVARQRNQRSRLVRHVLSEILVFRMQRQAASEQEALVFNDVQELVHVLPRAVPFELVCFALHLFTADGAVFPAPSRTDSKAEVLSFKVERLVYWKVAPIKRWPRLIGHFKQQFKSN